MTYLHHVTLNTGHSRQSPRAEAGAKGVGAAAIDLSKALTHESAPIAVMEGYRIKATTAGQALLCTVFAPGGAPLVTFGVAARSRDSAKLWSLMHDAAPGHQLGTDPTSPPPAPWCAVRIESGARIDGERWLADYERLIAWAWIEKAHRDA